jgi:Fe-Mn family superoxide dismutase
MITRRSLLELAALGAVAGATASAADAPYTLPKLPYAYDALEPYIDAQTMQIHHDKHHQAYVDNLNKAIGGDPMLARLSVEELLQRLDSLPAAIRTQVRNQGGGHANHSLWWQTLAPSAKGGKPAGQLADALNRTFGGQEKFEQGMRTAALGVFGSGWAWLTTDRSGTLAIESSANQDSPLSSGRQPILGIDVWEHAYYLKYQNRRPEYVAALYRVINWDFAGERFAKLTLGMNR